MQNTIRIALFAALILSAGACRIEIDTLFDGEVLPQTENAVYTDNGRFYTTSADKIYEVTSDSGNLNYSLIAQGIMNGKACQFGGMTDRGNLLYAVCMQTEGLNSSGELVRIDPSNGQMDRVDFPVAQKIFHLNGMDFGPDGALYISNSGALLTGGTAIYRVNILSESPLRISHSAFLDASKLGEDFDDGGGLFPNGIRFEGNTMFFARGVKLVKTQLQDGGHGPLQEVYRTQGVAVIDDFTIVEGHIFLAQANLLGLIDPNGFPSKLVVTDLNGDVKGETKLPVIPSSTSARRDTIFGDESVIITSFFNGGLHRVTVDR